MAEILVPEGEMSWTDIWELRRARQRDWEKGIRRPPPPEREVEGGYSYDEVMAEIRLLVSDTARFLDEDPGSGFGALAAAEEVARVRDDHRLRARGQVPLGESAGWFAGWLIRRAEHGDLPGAVRAAALAVGDSPKPGALGEELREFVRGYMDGSISGEEYTRRIEHPQARIDQTR